MDRLENFLPLDKAAKDRRVDKSILQSLVASGKLRGAMVEGVEVVNEQDLYTGVPKEDRPEYKQFAHLKGVGISIREASREFLIPNQTISRWVSKGFIAKLTPIGNKVIIDKADMAYCAEIYKRRPGRGKWPFNPDGTPYQVTTFRKR